MLLRKVTEGVTWVLCSFTPLLGQKIIRYIYKCVYNGVALFAEKQVGHLTLRNIVSIISHVMFYSGFF